jgi:hypothetical protein
VRLVCLPFFEAVSIKYEARNAFNIDYVDDDETQRCEHYGALDEGKGFFYDF